MLIDQCRTLNFYRNTSSTSSSSNLSNKTDAEWVTTSISLLIFSLAFVGNTAALIVMFGKQGPIRLTNNRYLANLACADLLRACFMPFTIIARMKRNFMFGGLICKILPTVQGLCVAVGIFTLVCISIERYLAICHPLLTLNLRSVRYAKVLNALILISIWISGLLIALPNIFLYNLCSLPKTDRYKCERISPDMFNQKLYMIAVDAFYFVIPIVVMIVLYTSIICKMYQNDTAKMMRQVSNDTRSFSFSFFKDCCSTRPRSPGTTQTLTIDITVRPASRQDSSRSRSCISDEDARPTFHSDICQTKYPYDRLQTVIHSHPKKICQRLSSDNSSSRSCTPTSSRMDRQRRKALKLLVTLIVEFFVCWTPLFIYHTIGTFNRNFYRSTSTIWVDLVLLLSFASASCNPLTYYFMSKRYRSVLYAYFPCRLFRRKKQMNSRQKHQHEKQLIKVLQSSEKNPVESMRINFHRHSRHKFNGSQ
ncbi:unnamed protein product [Adineta ricciae]|nr:unnamed protein product [Adineta ricciae]